MSILIELKKILGIYPKNPNEFVKKFLKDSKKYRSQLQLIYENEMLLQVDPLKFVPSWFKVAKMIDQTMFNDGFVVFFVLDKKDIGRNKVYLNFMCTDNLDMVQIEEVHGETEVITFAHFIDQNTTYISLTLYLRKFIDSIYKFKESNPQIIFNIRYLKNYSG